MNRLRTILCFCLLPSAFSLQASAQGTAFTYQGRLNDGASPANGIYDLRFTIYDLASSGTQQGGAVTNSATSVTNGLFTVTLDFGAGVFSGADRWLEMGVRTNGGGAFNLLSPRQQLTATPYATRAANAGTASSVSAANITGTIPLAQLPSQVVTNGASGVNFTGTFSGNGAGVTNVLMTTLNAPGVLSWPGNFTLSSSPDVGNVPRSVVAADINGDGKLDLISANNGVNTLSVLTNNGSGVFGLAYTYNVPTNPRSVAAADVNADGRPDLITTTTGPGALIVLTNTGSGFVTVSTNVIGGNVQMVIAVDVNGDSRPDLASVNGNIPGGLIVLTNTGSGFVTASTNTVGNNPFALTAADVNGDNFVDLISANNIAPVGTLSVLRNTGTGSFLAAIQYNVGNGPRSVTAADVNGDTFPDLISANIGGSTLSVLLNDGSGAFPASIPIVVGNSPVWVTAVDLDGNGKVDLICANNTIPGTLTAVTNNGSGVFLPAFTSSVGNLPFAVIAADVNADGRLDLVSANGVTPGTLSVLFNLPGFSGSFTGNGAGLTSLDATAVTAGTLAEARIDSTIARDSEILSLALAVDGAGSGLDADLLDGMDSSVFWKLGGNSGTTAGTHFLGTTDNQALELKVNGIRALRLEPGTNGAPNLIGGALINSVGGGTMGVVVAGGGTTNYLGQAYTNSVLSSFGVVGGGWGNRIAPSSGFASTIAGGFGNDIGTNSSECAIGGGHDNNIGANSGSSVIAGGYDNNLEANSFGATIPGGVGNFAGSYSFAAGRRAKALHSGAFVWADSTDADIGSTIDNSVTIRAGGGYRLFSTTATNAGVFLATGGTSWGMISDRNAKKNFQPVDVGAVLEKLARMPVEQWNYKWEPDTEVPHLGPMAQEFKTAFYPGRDDKSITTQEIDGVALAAIQGLNQKVEAGSQKSEDRIQKLEAENAELRSRLQRLEQAIQSRRP